MLTAARSCGRVRPETVCFLFNVAIIIAYVRFVNRNFPNFGENFADHSVREPFPAPAENALLRFIRLRFGMRRCSGLGVELFGELYDAARAETLGTELQEVLGILE